MAKAKKVLVTLSKEEFQALLLHHAAQDASNWEEGIRMSLAPEDAAFVEQLRLYKAAPAEEKHIIRIDDREKNTDDPMSSTYECLQKGNELCLDLLLRDEGDNGYADRTSIHVPGLIGWITGRSGQRQYFPSGGSAMGEAAPVTLIMLREIVKIMEMSIQELAHRAIEDSEQF